MRKDMAFKQIFIVSASTGTYDDYSTWQVVALASPEVAEKYRGLAQDEADAIIAQSTERYSISGPTRYDTQFHAIDRSIRYWVEPLVLFEEGIPEGGLFDVDPSLLGPTPSAPVPVEGTFADKLSLALTPA